MQLPNLFYQNRLKCGCNAENTIESTYLPISFIQMKNTEQFSLTSTSCFNQENAFFILQLIKGLVKKGIRKN
jgi:hypothetical protein